LATKQGLISVNFIDAYGINATTTYFVTIDDTKTVAQAMTDVGGLGLLSQELSQAAVTGWSLSVNDVPAEALPTPVGDVEKGGLFNFSNASDPYATGYWIPDISPSVLNSSGLINLSNTDVADFITFLTTAHTAITVVTKGVRALTALKDALISFRKHRKPLERRTKEVE